jgi:hypothetical protein
MANSIINTYNHSILNGNPIFKDCFAPFQLKSWLYFKGYILSREKWAHLDIAPYKNQEGVPLGEPLTYRYLLLTVSPTCLVVIVTIIDK